MSSTVLGIGKDMWAQTEAKEKRMEFPLPPEGVGIEWVISGSRMGTFKRRDESGEEIDIEYVNIFTTMTTDEGEEVKFSNFFSLETREDLGDLRFFLEKIGWDDFDPEENTLEELEGTRFYGDFKHYKKKAKGPGGKPEFGGYIVKRTIVPIDTGDDEEEEAPPKKKTVSLPKEKEEEPPKRRGRPPKARVEESEEPEEEPEEGEEEEEEEDVKPTPRRRRRFADSD